jgi:hypothetical protein
MYFQTSENSVKKDNRRNESALHPVHGGQEAGVVSYKWPSKYCNIYPKQ